MKNKINLEKVLRVNQAGLVVFLVLAFLVIVTMNHTAYQIVINYWTSNNLASQTATVFAVGSRVLFSIEMRWLLTTFMLICMVVPIVYIYLISSKKKNIDLEKYKSIDRAVTSAVMIAITAILAGVQDITALFILGSLVAIGYVFMWLASHYNVVEKKAYIAATVCQVLPWLVIVIYALFTLVYGSVRSPWYVYAIYLVGLIRLFMVVSDYYRNHKNSGKLNASDRLVFSIGSNMVFKAAFALILIIGLAR